MQNHNVSYVLDAYHTVYNIQNKRGKGRHIPLVCIPLTALTQKVGGVKIKEGEARKNAVIQ